MAVWLCWPAHLRKVNNIYTNTITDIDIWVHSRVHVHAHIHVHTRPAKVTFSFLKHETEGCSWWMLQMQASAASISCTPQSSKITLVSSIVSVSGFDFSYSPTFSIHGQFPLLHLHPYSAHFIPTTWPLGHQWAVNDAALFLPPRPYLCKVEWGFGSRGKGARGENQKLGENPGQREEK